MRNLEIKNQNGRSMIEMLGVLAIIGVLSVGGIAGYSKAMQKYRINKTIEQITLITGNVRSFFDSQGNYRGLISTNTGKAIIKKAKLVPDEMLELNADGTIKQINNSFGGTVLIEAANKSSSANGSEPIYIYGDEKAFALSFSDIPQEACIELVTQDWSEANIGALQKGGFIPTKNNVIFTPASIDIATNMCGSTNEISFFADVDTNSTYWKGLLGDEKLVGTIGN